MKRKDKIAKNLGMPTRFTIPAELIKPSEKEMLDWLEANPSNWPYKSGDKWMPGTAPYYISNLRKTFREAVHLSMILLNEKNDMSYAGLFKRRGKALSQATSRLVEAMTPDKSWFMPGQYESEALHLNQRGLEKMADLMRSPEQRRKLKAWIKNQSHQIKVKKVKGATVIYFYQKYEKHDGSFGWRKVKGVSR